MKYSLFFFSMIEKTLAVTFMIPVTIRITGDKVNYEDMMGAVMQAAHKKMSTGAYRPISMEEVHEVISENKEGRNEVPRANNRWSQAYNDVGTSGWKNANLYQGVQGHEHGASKRYDTSPAGRYRDASENHHQEKRGLHIDEAV